MAFLVDVQHIILSLGKVIAKMSDPMITLSVTVTVSKHKNVVRHESFKMCPGQVITSLFTVVIRVMLLGLRRSPIPQKQF